MADAPTATATAAGVQVSFAPDRASSTPSLLSSLGADEAANFVKVLERCGLERFHDPLLAELESRAPGSPEELAAMLRSGLPKEIGMRLFEAARFLRCLDEAQGAAGAAGAAARRPPSAFRMKGKAEAAGEVVRTAHEFLVAARLSRYSAELHEHGLSLMDLPEVTEDDLRAAGVDKEFHRKRFLREARNLTLPSASEPEPEPEDGLEPGLDGTAEDEALTSELDARADTTPMATTSPALERAGAGAIYGVRGPAAPTPQPEPEPAPAAAAPALDQTVDLARTGSAELTSFWEQGEAAVPLESRDAKAAQLFSMLGRSVAEPPKDNSFFERRFVLERGSPLGRGAFGVVLKGRDKQRQRDVAIKEVMPGRRKESLNAWEIKQLVREARAASCVQHPNVMRCYAYHRGARDRRFYLVMELLQGPNLEQVLKQVGPLREAMAVELMADCLEGLSAIHEARLIHRDIKLNNIVLHTTPHPSQQMERQEFDVGPIYGNHEAHAKATAWVKQNKPNQGWVFTGEWNTPSPPPTPGRVTSLCVFERPVGGTLMNKPVCKMIDFGMAKGTRDAETGEPLMSDGMMTDTDKVMGTPEYMSPEMWRGTEKQIDGRSDIWAIGVCVFQLLTGDVPFRAPRGQHRRNIIGEVLYNTTAAAPNVRRYAEARRRQLQSQGKTHLPTLVSHSIAQVVAHALMKKKEERFLTARSAREALLATQQRPPMLRPRLFDVFLCYRDGTEDEPIAHALHAALLQATAGPEAESLAVYTHKLTSTHAEVSTDALRSCGVFVPLLSAAAISSMEALGSGADDSEDRPLLEMGMALGLHEARDGQLPSLCPVLLEAAAELPCERLAQSASMATFSRLSELGLGSADDWTVQGTVSKMLEADPVQIPRSDALGPAVDRIVAMVTAQKTAVHAAEAEEEAASARSSASEDYSVVPTTAKPKPQATCSGSSPCAASRAPQAAADPPSPGRTPTTSDAEPESAATTLASLNSSRDTARKRVPDSDAAARTARKAHKGLCYAAAVAYLEVDAVLRDVRRAIVLAECELIGKPLLKAAFNTLYRGASDANVLLVGLGDDTGSMALVVDTLDLLFLDLKTLKQHAGVSVDRVGGGSELVLKFSPALHRAALLIRHDTQHDTVLQRAERDHLYRHFIPLLERERTGLRDPLLELLHGCRDRGKLARAARDAPAAVSAANIMLELVILLTPSSAPSFCAQEDTCADAERATEDLLKYLAFHAVPPAEEKEADTAKRTAMRQQLLDVLRWAEGTESTSEIKRTPRGWEGTPQRLIVRFPGLAKAMELLYEGERSAAVLKDAAKGGVMDVVLRHIKEKAGEGGARASPLSSDERSNVRTHAKALRFLRGDYYSTASRRQAFERLVARRRDDLRQIATLAAEAELPLGESEVKEARRAQQYMLERVQEWAPELGAETAPLAAAVQKLWAGERKDAALLGGMEPSGVGVQVMKHVMVLLEGEVAKAVEEHATKESAAMRAHDRLLRSIARVAAAPPTEQTYLDQTKCLQACTDLEETGVQLMGGVLAIFSGERDPSVVTRGMDRTDGALLRQIVAYISLGIEGMVGPGWEEHTLDLDSILSGGAAGGSGFTSSSSSGFGSGPGGSGGMNPFWSLVETGPLVDRRGRQHNPTHLGLREKAAIGIFFSGHWCPPSREFTPDLIDAYDMWARQKKFEIIFCSSDQTEEEYRDYLGEMPWKALPYEDPRIREFSDMYEIRGIPSLVIVGPDGRVITLEGRSRVSQDKGGYDFPWYPSSRRQQQCERALQAHLATVGTPLGSSMTSSGSTASSGGAAAGAGGATERTIQVRDGRKYSVGEVSTFNHNNTTLTGRVTSNTPNPKPTAPFAATICLALGAAAQAPVPSPAPAPAPPPAPAPSPAPSPAPQAAAALASPRQELQLARPRPAISPAARAAEERAAAVAEEGEPPMHHTSAPSPAPVPAVPDHLMQHDPAMDMPDFVTEGYEEVEQSGDDGGDMEERIAQLIAFTGTSREQALTCLQATGGDVQAAANMVLAG